MINEGLGTKPDFAAQFEGGIGLLLWRPDLASAVQLIGGTCSA